MSLEITIKADTAPALIEKMGQVARSMSSRGAEPVTVDTMLDAINMQLPAGMECVIVDNTADRQPDPESAPKKSAKKKAAKKADPAPEPEDDAPGQEVEVEGSAFDEALDILAECYADDDGKVAVKALLKSHDVTRFSEIDKSHGDDLLKSATKIKVDCGI